MITVSPLFIAIGKQLALQLAASYAATRPGVAVAATAVKSIIEAQAAVAAHNEILVQAQNEGWDDADERWDAPLAEQQERMEIENRRHDAIVQRDGGGADGDERL